MKIKTDDNQPIVIGIEGVETIDSFTYLGSVMDADKGSTADISARLKKARAAFYKLRKVWASSQYRRKTKLRIYKSNVMSVLQYGPECWKVNQNDKGTIHFTIDVCAEFYVYSGQGKFQIKNCMKR